MVPQPIDTQMANASLDEEFVPESPVEDHGIEYDDLDGEEGEIEAALDDSAFPLEGALRPPRPIPHAAKHLKEMLLNNEIDVNPDYQREVVWSTSAQSKILESYLKNYHVPPIVFCRRDNDPERLVCVDGKQRLTSLRNFFQGRIPYVNLDEDDGTYYFYEVTKSTPNKKGKLLPYQIKRKFDMLQIPCVEYTGLTEDQERTMFQRVQFGKALTPAEKLAALKGPWPEFIQTAINSLPPDFAASVRMNTAHKAFFGNMARMLWSIAQTFENGQDFKVPNEGLLNDWLTEKTGALRPSHELFKTRINRVLLLMAKLADENLEYRDIAFAYASELPISRDKDWLIANGRKLPKKPAGKLSPIEFMCIGLFLYKHGNNHNITPLAYAIKDFRNSIHARHWGKKMVNATVMATFIDWDSKWSDQNTISTNVPPPSPPPGFVTLGTIRTSPPPSSSKAKKSKSKSTSTSKTSSKPKSKGKPASVATPAKRKRALVPNSDDEDSVSTQQGQEDDGGSESDGFPAKRTTKAKKVKM